MESFNATKRLSFKIEEEDFSILLPVNTIAGKIVPTETSQKFCDFLCKHLNLLTSGISEDLNFQEINVVASSNNGHISYMIRKKASLLGLQIELGEHFEKVRKEGYKRAVAKIQSTSRQ